MFESGKQDQQSMKINNMLLVLNLIIKEKKISRAHLARKVHMSATSVSRIVSQLIELGIVKENRSVYRESVRVGKQPIYLVIDTERLYVVNVEIDLNRTRIAISTLTGIIIGDHEFFYKGHNEEQDAIIEHIQREISNLLDTKGLNQKQIIGIGIGIPGIINNKTGEVVFSPQLGWSEVNLASLFEKKFGVRTIVDSLINVRALGESLDDSQDNSTLSVLVSFGTGVGLALIMNDNIYRGISNSAGEIGHTTVEPEGRLCECGRRGCLQTYISEWSILQEANKYQVVETVDEIFYQYKLDKEWAIQIIDRLYEYIALTICNVIYLYNPYTLILSGTYVEKHLSIERIRAIVEKSLWQPFKKTYRIKYSSLGGNSIIYGDVNLLLNEYVSTNI